MLSILNVTEALIIKQTSLNNLKAFVFLESPVIGICDKLSSIKTFELISAISTSCLTKSLNGISLNSSIDESSKVESLKNERTKQGLAAARAMGKVLGRPKGAKNKTRVLDPYKEEISQLFSISVSQSSALKIINAKLDKPISMTALRYYIANYIV